jgi:chromosomal replication initiation ATPase DnaA
MQELIAYNEWRIKNEDRFFQEYLNTLSSNNNVVLKKQYLNSNEMIRKIKAVVKEITGLNFSNYNTKTRSKEIVFARQLFCYLIKNNTNLSLTSIGNLFQYYGYNRSTKQKEIKTYNHSSIISSCEIISGYLSINSPEKQIILQALEKLKT